MDYKEAIGTALDAAQIDSIARVVEREGAILSREGRAWLTGVERQRLEQFTSRMAAYWEAAEVAPLDIDSGANAGRTAQEWERSVMPILYSDAEKAKAL